MYKHGGQTKKHPGSSGTFSMNNSANVKCLKLISTSVLFIQRFCPLHLQPPFGHHALLYSYLTDYSQVQSWITGLRQSVFEDTINNFPYPFKKNSLCVHFLHGTRYENVVNSGRKRLFRYEIAKEWNPLGVNWSEPFSASSLRGMSRGDDGMSHMNVKMWRPDRPDKLKWLWAGTEVTAKWLEHVIFATGSSRLPPRPRASSVYACLSSGWGGGRCGWMAFTITWCVCVYTHNSLTWA